eukprot:SAG31_NODE_3687_length_3987_cov_4.811214_3_plen_74_part_00
MYVCHCHDGLYGRRRARVYVRPYVPNGAYLARRLQQAAWLLVPTTGTAVTSVNFETVAAGRLDLPSLCMDHGA